MAKPLNALVTRHGFSRVVTEMTRYLEVAAAQALRRYVGALIDLCRVSIPNHPAPSKFLWCRNNSHFDLWQFTEGAQLSTGRGGKLHANI
jgi:hypothetical protein